MKRKAYNMTLEEIDAATLALNNQRGAMHFLIPVAPELRSKIGTVKDNQQQVRDATEALHKRVCPDCLKEE